MRLNVKVMCIISYTHKNNQPATAKTIRQSVGSSIN